MAPQRSSSAKAHFSKNPGLRQGTLSFTSAKRSSSTSAKDNLKGKAAACTAPIRVGGKRKYESDHDPEPDSEQGREAADVLEREKLDPEDPRWSRAFGLAREKMGNIRPAHAQDQSPVHHILRIFDLSYEYGPCVGVTRLERWERAATLGLNPPREVREILMTKEGSEDTRLIQNVLYDEV